MTYLAARLSSVAERGQILMGSETAQRLGETYRLQKLNPTQLQQVAEAKDIYTLIEKTDM